MFARPASAHRKATALVATLCSSIAGACSADSASSSDGDDLPDVFVFSENHQCRSPLRTGAAAAEACVLPDDCAEVCCSCDDADPTFSAQACVAGTCAGRDAACMRAEQTTDICRAP